MAQDTRVRLLASREGIAYAGDEIRGFPYVSDMPVADQVRVARWAQQLAPQDLAPEQEQLLAHHRRVRTDQDAEALRQDRLLSSPLVRTLWRRLDGNAQRLVLNPDQVGGTRYPLRTNELARLTGLTPRQVRYWSDRRLLRHWLDDRGHRRFEAPAAIVAFAMRDSKQHERQFYSDMGQSSRSLGDIREALSLIGVPLLDAAEGADPEELRETEELLRVLADTIHEQLAAVAV